MRRQPARRLLLVLLAAVPLVSAACGSKSTTGPTSSGPRVLSVTPSSGSTSGGTAVTIAGTGFSDDATVTIGGVAATGIVVSGSTSITATTGARTASGAAEVVVTTGGKTASLPNAFTFVAPSGANRPPVVSGFRSIGSRTNQPSGFADLDETVQITPTVNDAETTNAALTFEWSGPGLLTASGSTLMWKIPSSLPSGTPATVPIGLTVTERFVEGGVTHQQSTAATFPVRVHDSQKEILDAGEDFLMLFSDSSKTTDQVLHNFSTTCDGGKGRAAEAADTDRNRAQFIQNYSAARVVRRPPATFNFVRQGCFPAGRLQPGTDACASFAVHWEVTYRSDGRREIADGIDYVSAVLENDRWLLCHSDFIGTVTNPVTLQKRSVIW
jgi:hypothetical protein